MLRVSVANVTASALKRPVLVAILVGLLLVAGWSYWRQTSCTIELQQGCIGLDVAITHEQRAQGLSGRQSLAQNEGMLFVYDQPQKTCFWMKDTQFDLDIIWLNDHKQITQIKTDAKPVSYPETFCSNASTKYVIELPAGAVERNQLMVGQQLHF